jgi:hypothetical protein
LPVPQGQPSRIQDQELPEDCHCRPSKPDLPRRPACLRGGAALCPCLVSSTTPLESYPMPQSPSRVRMYHCMCQAGPNVFPSYLSCNPVAGAPLCSMHWAGLLCLSGSWSDCMGAPLDTPDQAWASTIRSLAGDDAFVPRVAPVCVSPPTSLYSTCCRDR